MEKVYAHSVPDRPAEEWESLAAHLAAVAEQAAVFGAAFGWATAARAAGLLHDIGKCSGQFQAYIRRPHAPGRRGGDHSIAGARAAVEAYSSKGRLLAYAVAGHHAGLADWGELDRRLADLQVGAAPGWRDHSGAIPKLAALRPTQEQDRGDRKGFAKAFLTRMLFSTLVDADYLCTERFLAGARGETAERGGYRVLPDLAVRLRTHLAGVARGAKPTEVNALRAEVLAHATARAGQVPGLFTLTVPTGGGKTLTSLSFAMEHALANELRRIVYVIPFTSIIEQTAEVFRRALATEDDVLEHHASFDWDIPRGAVSDDLGQDGRARLQRATENWDAPVIVTTAVQFFESLFASRPSRCRKLHSLAGSVIVLDEAQTLPLALMQPCLAALEELCRNYGASVVLCTATQPSVRRQDGFRGGLDIPDSRELAPEPRALYQRLRRVRVEQAGEVDDAAIAARFATASQMLCIVNTRKHASELFEHIRALDGAAQLTTLMVPRHRRAELVRLRERLCKKLPVRLVATSLIEAGVDIDFPEVWRAMAGLDSVAQAAGRCNREGGPVLGRVVVFQPTERKVLKSMAAATEVTADVLKKHEDPLALAAVRDFFQNLYWNKGEAAFDAAWLDGKCFPILPNIADGASRLDFPFASIARAFRLIDEAMEPVIVPWKADEADHHARDLLARIAASERPRRADLRALQQYTVPVPARARGEWLAKGVLRAVHPALDPAVLMFEDDSLYDEKIGLRLFDPTYRSAESNIP